MTHEPTMEISEVQARRLRANIYGECSDNNWSYCNDNWTEPQNFKWLLDHQPKNIQ